MLILVILLNGINYNNASLPFISAGRRSGVVNVGDELHGRRNGEAAQGALKGSAAVDPHNFVSAAEYAMYKIRFL